MDDEKEQVILERERGALYISEDLPYPRCSPVRPLHPYLECGRSSRSAFNDGTRTEKLG